MPSPTFFLPDTSAIFNYSPCINCGPSGWQSAFSRKPDGFDQTFHQAPSNGSSVSVAFNITASGMTISHASVGTSCAVGYSLNGSSFRAACGEDSGLRNLPFGRHQMMLKTLDGANQFQFFGVQALGKVSASMVNRTIDDTSSHFTYSPTSQWSHVDSSGPVGTLSNSTAVTTLGSGSNFFNSSMGVTTQQGAKVDLKFTGEGIYLFGMSGPEGGRAVVVLDGLTQAVLNSNNPWNAYSSLLWMTSGLDPATEHTVSITNTLAGKQLVLDYALITIPKPAGGGAKLPLIIGTAVGSLAAVLLILLVLCLYFRRRRRFRRNSDADYIYGPGAYGFADGIGSDDRSKHSSIDWWRRQTSLHYQGSATLPKFNTGAPTATASEFGDGPMGKVYAQPAMGSEYGNGTPISERYPIAKLYAISPGSKVSDITKFTTKSAEQQQDYIPYKPPPGWSSSPRSLFPPSAAVSPPAPRRALVSPNSKGVRSNGNAKSRSSGRKGSQTARSPLSANSHGTSDVPLTPLISGLDPTAERWLQANSDFNSINNANGALSRTGSGHDGSGHLSRNPSGKTALTDGPSSPRSFSEDFSLVQDVRHARRSIARLWPSREAVPSLYRIKTNEDSALPYTAWTRGVDNSPESSAPRTGALTNASFADSPHTFSHSHSHLYSASGLPPSAYPHPNAQLYHASPGSFSRHPFPSASKAQSIASRSLRRGVSIKSVKTVKSFFSTLLRSDQPPTPQLDYGEMPMPMVNTSGDGNMGHRVARPDSDLFPSAADRSRAGTPGMGHGNVKRQLRDDQFEIQLEVEADERRGDRRSGTRDGDRDDTGRRRRSSGSASRSGSISGSGSGSEARISPGSANMFIELSPESPVSMRPESGWPSVGRNSRG